MAWELKLRVGETATYDVVLTTAPCMVTEYPLNSSMLMQEPIMNMGDGNSLSVPTFANVVESIDLHIQAATPSLVKDVVRSIERVLDYARQGSLGALTDKVYLCIKFDQDSGEWWRSQILAAQWSGPEAVDRIWKNYTTGTIALTRRYFWEMETLQAVAVSSGVTTTATTGYATVYNADDTNATNRNWFQVGAAQVVGSLPAPAKISIKNISAGDRYVTSVYLGNYVFCSPTSIDPIYRAEDASSAFTTVSTTEAPIYRWSLATSGLVDDFHGQFGRFLVVWNNRPDNTTLVRAKIDVAGSFDIGVGEQALGNAYLTVQDLGALPIPPSGYSDGMGKTINLTLTGKTATGTDTVSVDWLQIFPSGQGRFRAIHGAAALTFAVNNEIIDDGPAGVTYAYDVALGAKVPTLRPMFDPIYLWPGLTQRIRLLISGGAFGMEAGQPWGCKIEYRPRRLTL
jgi:hypothetical protein